MWPASMDKYNLNNCKPPQTAMHISVSILHWTAQIVQVTFLASILKYHCLGKYHGIRRIRKSAPSQTQEYDDVHIGITFRCAYRDNV